jgi:hypothetical protein
MDYQPSRSSGQMRNWLGKLREKDSVDYVIALVEPKMTGTVHSSYSPNGGSSYTVYTTNVRFGVWSAESGELAYASGAIASTSGFCIFLSPQSAAIDDNNRDLSNQLQKNHDGMRQASSAALR